MHSNKITYLECPQINDVIKFYGIDFICMGCYHVNLICHFFSKNKVYFILFDELKIYECAYIEYNHVLYYGYEQYVVSMNDNIPQKTHIKYIEFMSMDINECKKILMLQ